LDGREGEDEGEGEENAEKEKIPCAVVAPHHLVLIGELDDHAAQPEHGEEGGENPGSGFFSVKTLKFIGAG
jgi:hypothetical protein